MQKQPYSIIHRDDIETVPISPPLKEGFTHGMDRKKKERKRKEGEKDARDKGGGRKKKRQKHKQYV